MFLLSNYVVVNIHFRCDCVTHTHIESNMRASIDKGIRELEVIVSPLTGESYTRFLLKYIYVF